MSVLPDNNESMPASHDEPPPRFLKSANVLLASLALLGFAIASLAIDWQLAHAGVSVEFSPTRTQCYQGQPRRELWSMRLLPGIHCSVLQQRTLVIPLHLQSSPD